MDSKEHVENWENEAETFKEWKEDNFYTVTEIQMNEAVRKFGSRKRRYWN